MCGIQGCRESREPVWPPPLLRHHGKRRKGVLLRFDPDVADGRSWTLLGNSPGSLGCVRPNVFLLGPLLDHSPVPKRSKHAGRAGRISPDEDAVQGASNPDPPSVHLPPRPNDVRQGPDFCTRLQAVVVKRRLRAGNQHASARGPFHSAGQTKGVVKQCPPALLEAVVADVGLTAARLSPATNPCCGHVTSTQASPCESSQRRRVSRLSDLVTAVRSVSASRCK